jgi:hypothetical protein
LALATIADHSVVFACHIIYDNLMDNSLEQPRIGYIPSICLPPCSTTSIISRSMAVNSQWRTIW